MKTFVFIDAAVFEQARHSAEIAWLLRGNISSCPVVIFSKNGTNLSREKLKTVQECLKDSFKGWVQYDIESDVDVDPTANHKDELIQKGAKLNGYAELSPDEEVQVDIITNDKNRYVPSDHTKKCLKLLHLRSPKKEIPTLILERLGTEPFSFISDFYWNENDFEKLSHDDRAFQSETLPEKIFTPKPRSEVNSSKANGFLDEKIPVSSSHSIQETNKGDGFDMRPRSRISGPSYSELGLILLGLLLGTVLGFAAVPSNLLWMIPSALIGGVVGLVAVSIHRCCQEKSFDYGAIATAEKNHEARENQASNVSNGSAYQQLMNNDSQYYSLPKRHDSLGTFQP